MTEDIWGEKQDRQLAKIWHKFIEDHKGDIDDSYLFDCLKETIHILRPDLYGLSLFLDVAKPSKAKLEAEK